MFCAKCGKEVKEGAAFCAACGAPTAADLDKTVSAFGEQPVPAAPVAEPVAPVYEEPVSQPVYAEAVADEIKNNGSVNFGEAINLLFKNIFNYSGKASLSEFWWGYLFIALVSLASYIPYIGWMVAIAACIPSLSLAVRRLNDIGKPWSFIFMGLIPFAGAVILIINFCKPTDFYKQ